MVYKGVNKAFGKVEEKIWIHPMVQLLNYNMHLQAHFSRNLTTSLKLIVMRLIPKKI
jgi:hypothetical protein